MDKLSFTLQDFEGPLDLLLHLISKHKLNILDIEISALLEQYMAFIDKSGVNSMEVASDFLEMAARLVHIKTIMLLPKHESEADDLKSKLTGELMERHLCKMAATSLCQLANEHAVFVRKPMVIDADMTYTLTHSPQMLFGAIATSSGRVVRQRPVAPSTFNSLVKRKVVSISSRIVHLLRRLYKNQYTNFSELFADATDKSELIATFLAVLELVKGGRLKIDENGEKVSFSMERKKKGEKAT